MSQTLVDQQMARLKALLSEERAGSGLEPADPLFPAAELGALHGVGFQTRKPDVQVSVYVFSESSARRDAATRLKALYSADAGMYARSTSNGPMLFFAHTRVDHKQGRDAEYRLDRIMSAFAGDE